MIRKSIHALVVACSHTQTHLKLSETVNSYGGLGSYSRTVTTYQLKKGKTQAVTLLPVADPIKHELVREKLTNKLVRQSNIVKPTEDDIRVAVSRAETALKRADLDYKKSAELKLRTQQRK